MYKEKEKKQAKDKAKATEEAIPEVPVVEKVDSPNPQVEEEVMPELAATISNPQEELAPGRLSIISEASTSVRSPPMSSLNSPNLGQDGTATFPKDVLPTIPDSTATTAPATNQEELPKTQETEAEPRTSGEMSTIPASSPTSLIDLSELENSTRATSIIEQSDRESLKEDAEESDARRQTIVETPSQSAEDDEGSQSSTPTAAPTTIERTAPADEKEKRRAAVAPLTIPAADHHDGVSEAGTEHSLGDDEDLMDELDGAEVQEAFSVSVTKSPITPFFNRRPSSAHAPGSPASLILSTDKTPPPLPSPLPASLDRPVSAQEAAIRAASISRSMSGSMQKDEVKVAENEVERDTSLETTPKRKRDTEDNRATIMPEIKRTSAEPIEQVSPKQISPRKSSLPARKPSNKKSRKSSVSKVITSQDRSPSYTSLSRASSGAMLSPGSDDSLSVHKKRVGSGVAAKIADLQRNFSRGSTIGPPEIPSSRKSSMVSGGERTPPRSAHSNFRDEHLFRGRAMSKGSMRSFESKDTRTSTPPRNKSSGSVGRLDSKRFTSFNNPALEVSSKPDTIQVKATIIRTDIDRGNDATGLGLQHTPTEADQAKIVAAPEPSYAHPRTSVIVEEPRSPNRTSMDKAHRRARSSLSSALGLMGIRSGSVDRSTENPGSPVVSSEGRRSARNSLDIAGGMRSLRRRASASMSRSPSVTRDSSARSPSQQGRYSPMPLTPMTNGSSQSAPHFARSMSSSSLESSATADYDGHSEKNKRKGSRASRMLKRMSNSMSSMMHSGGNEKNAQHHQSKAVETVEEEKWVGADLGEMNVQFPDTLVSLLFFRYPSKLFVLTCS